MLEAREKVKQELPEGFLIQNVYRDIKPTKETSESSKEFWNDVFSKSESKEIEYANLDELIEELFNIPEEGFIFDFDCNSPEIISLLDILDDPTWARMPEKGRIEVINSFEKFVGDKLGIKELPILEFFDGESYACGAQNADSNIIKINKALLDNPQELVNTMAHELRHAYQNMRAMEGKTYMDFLYLLNYIYYITPEMGFSEYEDQLVEAEARAFANMFELKGEMV